MKYIYQSHPKELLKNIPDFILWKEAEQWLKGEIDIAEQLNSEQLSDLEFTSLEWKDVEEIREGYFGLYAIDKWRKFVLAVFLADLVSYREFADRVDFERLLFVMHAFPQGFRIWWAKLPDHQWHPVGYTAWYPMLRTTFEQFRERAETLRNRLVAPCGYSEDSLYLYLFNFSVNPAFKKSALSKDLMKKFAQDILEQKPAGLACITVSEEGVRVAERLGMALAGYLCYEGNLEGVYTTL